MAKRKESEGTAGKKEAGEKKEFSKKDNQREISADYDIAYDFSIRLYREFKTLIKSIALFGSVAKNKITKNSDIDIIVIVDDCTIKWDNELIIWYRTELGKLVEKQEHRKKLHINTITLSSFWYQLKVGEPLAINVLRYSEPIIDLGGFFAPLKVLLMRGLIRPSPEAIQTTLRRVPWHLSRSNYNILNAIEGMYWAMVDSAHAALMSEGHTPPSPEHIYDMLKKVFVSKGRLKSNRAEWFREMFILIHNIVHSNVRHISGDEIEKHRGKVKAFVDDMKRIVEMRKA